jgi:hypothetical protein
MYQLFYVGENPPELANLPRSKNSVDSAWVAKEKMPVGRPGSAAILVG